MAYAARPFRLAGLLAFTLCLVASPLAIAQANDQEFITGAATAAWNSWQKALQAVLARDPAGADAAFGELLAQNPSPLRVALLESRTLDRSNLAGAVLLLEQDRDAGAASDKAKAVLQLLETGREQRAEADDGWYFCRIGRFDVAQANFSTLIASKPDPVALLEFSERLPDRTELLVKVSDNPTVGESAAGILKLMAEGERQIKADPTRIRQNIDRLAGPPRAFDNGVARLKDSGEYAVPFLVQTLTDSSRKDLLQPILKALPQISRPALNPLVMALRVKSDAVRRYLIAAAAQIGYVQAVPYLLAIRDDANASADARAAVDAALAELTNRGVQVPTGMTAAEAFFRLARNYYDEQESLRPDPRLETANVWYWRDELVQPVAVPTVIFDEIMCMRCCEEALRLAPDMKAALALWLAADFRREAQLPAGQTDATRPDNYPTAAYFAQSAGPEYCLMTLARALDAKEPAVALGAIEALRRTGGAVSLTNDANGRNPLAEALNFPDRLVRIRAALALAACDPQREFNNSQNLTPVLVEGLSLYNGTRGALIADPDADGANALAAKLRTAGYNAIVDASLLGGLQKARNEPAGIDVAFIASNIHDPALTTGLAQLRSDLRFASVPALVILKSGDRETVEALTRSDSRVALLTGGEDDAALKAAIDRVQKSVGAAGWSPEKDLSIATEACNRIIQLLTAHNPLLRPAELEPTLIQALRATDPALRLLVAKAITFLPTPGAQEALAGIALNDAEKEETRVALFGLVAESAKRNGAQLGGTSIEHLTKIAESDANMTIRTAASEALGALNLPGNPASVIIRNQYNG